MLKWKNLPLWLALACLLAIPKPAPAQDCNANGIPDAQDIDPTDPDGNGMVSPDCNGDLRPDECEFPQFLGDLFASDGQAGDRFGSAIAASGTAVLIGAPNADIVGPSSTVSDAGACYVFRQGLGGWVEEQKLVASTPIASSNFGYKVALDGNVAVVAADIYNPGIGIGVAYVFRFDGSAWIEETILMPTDVIMGDNASVAVSGDAVFLCSPRPVFSSGQTGYAVAFRYDGTSWNQEQVIAAPPNWSYSRSIGRSVALDGDTVIIGAEGDLQYAFEVPEGFARVYGYNGTEWAFVRTLTPNPPEFSFGRDVALAGDTILIAGGPFNINELTAGYTFFRDNGVSWSRQDDAPSLFPLGSRSAVALNQMYAVVNRTTLEYSGNLQIGVQIFEKGPDGFAYSHFIDTVGAGPFALADHTLFSGHSFDEINGSNAGSVALFDLRAANDCNANTIPDACELEGNDCDGNGVPDDCQFDCNNNGVIDDCEAFTDCNDNLLPDECELVDNDCNANGIPDDC